VSWSLVKLGDICTTTQGVQITKANTKEEPYQGGYRYLYIADFMSEKKLSFVDDEFDHKKVTSNDLVMANTGSPGRVFKGKDGILSNNLFKISFDNNSVDRDYLYMMLSSNVFQSLLQKQMKGGIQKHLGHQTISRQEIPLPPLEEQKRIAAILDKADAIRHKRQQAIQLADDFLRSVFLDMFGDPVTNQMGWEEKILKDIADIRSGVTKGKKLKPEDSITLPYMRVANVQDGYLCLDEVKDITVSNRDAEKCQLQTGDILLTEGGDIDKLGRGYVWNGEIENCIHQNHIFSVRVNSRDVVRPEFLSVLISSQRGKRYFLKVGKQTTGIATINKTVLSEFVPFIPPIELQDKYLKVHNKIKSLFIGWGGNCSLAFNSLSQKAFAGEL